MESSAPNKKKEKKKNKLSSILVTLMYVCIIATVVYVGTAINSADVPNISQSEEPIENLIESTPDTLQLSTNNIIPSNNNDKIKKMIIRLQPKIDENIADLITTSVIKHSEDFSIPPELIIAIICRESSFNVLAKSSANCVGLMQINPKAHQDKFKKYGIDAYTVYHIDNNIFLGCAIFAEYYKYCKFSLSKTLKRYVGGSNEGYIRDILEIFSEESINQLMEK